jgi:hypothetical protein
MIKYEVVDGDIVEVYESRRSCSQQAVANILNSQADSIALAFEERRKMKGEINSLKGQLHCAESDREMWKRRAGKLEAAYEAKR